MKAIEVSAKTVEKAIEEGLKQLGVTQDQVDIKILDEGGFFRKAKVQLSLEGAKEEEVKAEIAAIKEEIKKPAKTETKPEKTKTAGNLPFEASSTAKAEAQKKASAKVQSTNLSEAAKEVAQIGTKFLQGLLEQLSISASVAVTETEQGITFSVTGDNVSELIGHRGETLNSLQYLLSIIAKTKEAKGTRIYLDVEGYKLRREDSLSALAQRMAEKCIKIGKPVRLDPMNAYERKIIHSALQENPGVTTKSEGEEPRRFLIIIPKK
ncbi:MAG: protein jag [Christensenellaceae bacterium]|jgi:spoIIIJ-associated protein|nr:protein jag [Christensenellaceae bacterium]